MSYLAYRVLSWTASCAIPQHPQPYFGDHVPPQHPTVTSAIAASFAAGTGSGSAAGDTAVRGNSSTPSRAGRGTSDDDIVPSSAKRMCQSGDIEPHARHVGGHDDDSDGDIVPRDSAMATAMSGYGSGGGVGARWGFDNFAPPPPPPQLPPTARFCTREPGTISWMLHSHAR